MADRVTRIILRGEIGDFTAKMAAAGRAATQSFDAATAAALKNRQAYDDVGAAAGKVGLAAAGGLAAATKAAIDWESAWAGVTKTVDGSPEQMAALEGELRNLATTLPATHEEIAGVAEAAGQLGVAREDISSFTKTMIDLSETTNLTADEASTSIAQMMNVMQTAPEDVDNLGSALVALGNDGASTERDIVQMSQRIAGAAAIVGMSEADVLAFSNAMASMGIEADAGGTAVSRVITDMGKAAKQGGDDLELFARVAGQSAEEFAQAFATDPAQAFTTFIQGLQRIQSAGGDVFTVLDDIGLSDVRVSRALLGMASSGDLLTDSLKLGASAWEQNTALADEAAKRYDTTASQIQVAWNKIKDAAIDVGGTLLPMLADVADVVGGLAEAFGGLPEPVQKATVAMLALAAVGGTGIWAGTKFLTTVGNLRDALRTLGAQADMTGKQLALRGVAAGIGALTLALNDLDQSSDRATRTLGTFANIGAGALLGFAAGGPVGAAIGGGVAAISALVGELGRQDDQARKAAQATAAYADTLDQMTGAATESTRELALNRLEQEGVLKAAEDLGLNTRYLVDGILGNANAAEAFSNQLADLRAELDPTTTLSERFADGTRRSAGELAVGIFAANNAKEANSGLLESLDKVAQAFETESSGASSARDEIDRKARADSTAADESEKHATAADESADAMSRQKQEAEEVAAAFQAMSDVLAGRGRERAYQQALDDINARVQKRIELQKELNREDDPERRARLREELREYAKTLDTTTQAGRDNAAALDDIASSAIAVAEEMDDIDARRDFLVSARRNIADAAEKMGLSEKQARALARELLDVDSVDPTVNLDTRGADETGRDLDRVKGKANDIPKSVQTKLEALDHATPELTTVARKLREIDGDTATVTINTRNVATNIIRDIRKLSPFADGGTVDFFAGGAEHHVAQIAPAGAWRVWAEPETGGEAYIPLAPHKRERSLDIWAEVGKRLGVASFASGTDPRLLSGQAGQSPVLDMAGLLSRLDGLTVEAIGAAPAQHVGAMFPGATIRVESVEKYEQVQRDKARAEAAGGRSIGR